MVTVNCLNIGSLNSLPNSKIWALTKLKAFAFYLAKMLNSLFHRVENIVGKGENDGY